MVVTHLRQPAHAFAMKVNRGLRFGELRAGRFVDDRRRAIVVDRFARCFYSLIGEQRIGLRDLLHAKCAEHFLDRDRRTEPAHERCTRAWMRLRTGHRGGRVIEHYDGDVMLVVNRIGRAVIPEAKNVESPTNAIAFLSGSITLKPCAIVMPAPMSRQVSTALSGAALPSV